MFDSLENLCNNVVALEFESHVNQLCACLFVSSISLGLSFRNMLEAFFMSYVDKYIHTNTHTHWERRRCSRCGGFSFRVEHVDVCVCVCVQISMWVLLSLQNTLNDHWIVVQAFRSNGHKRFLCSSSISAEFVDSLIFFLLCWRWWWISD